MVGSQKNGYQSLRFVSYNKDLIWANFEGSGEEENQCVHYILHDNWDEKKSLSQVFVSCANRVPVEGQVVKKEW